MQSQEPVRHRILHVDYNFQIKVRQHLGIGQEFCKKELNDYNASIFVSLSIHINSINL